jgi:hypothetical protein
VKTGNSATVSYSAGYAAINIAQSDATTYGIDLSQEFALNSGTTYIVTFDAWSTGSRTLEFDLQEATNWHWQSGGSVTLSATKSSYTVDLIADTTTALGVLQINAGLSTLPVNIENIVVVKSTNTAIAPRTAFAAAPSWSLIRSGANLIWTRSEALPAGGMVRLVGIDGRELSRSMVPAGAKSGSLKAPGAGIAFLVLESADVREVQALPLAR